MRNLLSLELQHAVYLQVLPSGLFGAVVVECPVADNRVNATEKKREIFKSHQGEGQGGKKQAFHDENEPNYGGDDMAMEALCLICPQCKEEKWASGVIDISDMNLSLSFTST